MTKFVTRLKALGWLAAILLCSYVGAQDYSVAIIEPTGNRDVRNQIPLVRNQFIETITKTRGFKLLDRARTDQIVREHQFQRTSGLISTSEARELGKMLGVDWIFASELTMYDGELEINCQVLDIVTGQVVGAKVAQVSTITAKAIREESEDLMIELLKAINTKMPGGMQRMVTGAGGGSQSLLPGLDVEIRNSLLNNRSNAKWNSNKGNYMLEVDLSNVIIAENRQFGASVHKVTGTIHFTLSDTENGHDSSADFVLAEFTEMGMDLIRNKIKAQIQPKIIDIIRELLSGLD